MKADAGTEAAVFGAVDGLVVVLGLIAGMLVAGYGHGAVWHAALSGGLAELAGMTAGKRKSDGSPWPVAATCGLAAFAGAVLPALPYVAWGGGGAVAVSLILTVAIAAAATLLRTRERVIPALAETCALLAGAAVLTVLGGLT